MSGKGSSLKAARNRWQEGGGKAAAAAAAANLLQASRNPQQPGGVGAAGGVPASQNRRARGAYAGLFMLLVTVWSAILISAIFSLRVNRENCENCPVGCRCRETPPAWG